MKITKKLKKIEDKLKALAQADYKHPVNLETHIAPGPFQIPVMTVCYPKAHPGTGMRRILLGENERAYGRHGEGDVADLIRGLGLMTTTDAQQLLRLVNIAYYDGIALLVNPDPKITHTKNTLELKFTRTLHPSGQKLLVTFIVKETGLALLTEINSR
ncbi:MAG: hypothetical protein IPJ69_14840 [Deltaproteobacteria bacterium]|nr:MAG: hypothetical protein IPJ69_14840 [Deltaproteobacteria bacterium]